MRDLKSEYTKAAHNMYARYSAVQAEIDFIEQAVILNIKMNNPHITSMVHIKKAASAQLRNHDEYMQLVGDRTWMMAVAQLNATMALLP